MSKQIGLFWLRDDFRIKNNSGLSEATNNHENVSVFYLYNKSEFENRELKIGGSQSL